MMSVIISRAIYTVAVLTTVVVMATSTIQSVSPMLNHHLGTTTNSGIENNNDDSCSTPEMNGINNKKELHHAQDSNPEMRQDVLSLSKSGFTTTTMILDDLRKKYHHQPLFLQAVQEMILSIDDLLDVDPVYRQAFAIITEPERTISFRVTWMDDHGQVQINRGWRIEFNR